MHSRKKKIKKDNRSNSSKRDTDYSAQFHLLKNTCYSSAYPGWLKEEKPKDEDIELSCNLTENFNHVLNDSSTIEREKKNKYDEEKALNLSKNSNASNNPVETSKCFDNCHKCVPRELLYKMDDYTIDTRVIINVSGRIFSTYKNTLEHFPNTLLGSSSDRRLYYDKIRKEYFFERHPLCFEAILYFYQSRGRLYRPKDVPIDVFIDELEFFKFEREIINELMQRENLHLLPVAPDVLPRNKYFRQLWLFFEYPTSLFAKLVSALSAFLIILSVICACLETVDFAQFQQKNETNKIDLLNVSNTTLTSINITTSLNSSPLLNGKHNKRDSNNNYSSYITLHYIYFIIEMLCNIWFLIEFLFRLISCPEKIKFLKNFLNLLDIFIMGTYLVMTVLLLTDTTYNANRAKYGDWYALSNYQGAKAFNVLRILKLVRIIRLFKLTKYTKLLQVLVLTLMASVQAVIILVLTLIIGVILFASLIYYAESTVTNTDFRSIPDGFWYTLNVMTTVGDSDAQPRTLVGKIVSSACAIAGILVIGIPIPVIVANFSRYYQVLVENTCTTYNRFTIQQKDEEATVV